MLYLIRVYSRNNMTWTTESFHQLWELFGLFFMILGHAGPIRVESKCNQVRQ